MLALGVRLAAQLETREVPTVRHLVGDAAAYHAWAQRIAAGDWIGTESFYQAPLYPYVLAVWLRLFGDSIGTIRALQALLGAASCALLCLGTTRLWGARVGLIAGILLALYGPAVYYDGIIQKASLTGFLTCALFAALAWNQTASRSSAALVVGAVAGLLSITRENAMIWVALLGIWFIARFLRSPSTCKHAAAFALGVGLILVPVGLRNWKVGGEWAISTFQAGPNFYIGNHRGADGRYQPLVRGHETPQFERTDATQVAQQATQRILTPNEVSRFWLRRGFEEIREAPGEWMRLLANKLLLTVNRYEIADAESLYIHGESSWVLSVLTRLWHFGVLLPLAAVGFLAARRDWNVRLYVLMIASMIVAVTAFYVLGRYRFPIAVLGVPFAALGLLALRDAARQRQRRDLMGFVLVAIVVGVLVNIPVQDERRLNALAKMNAGVALAQDGQIAAAKALFESALAEHPDSAEGHYNLALALAVQGRFAESVEHYLAAQGLEPTLPGVEFNLAVALENAGRTDAALEHYRRAVAEDPNDAQARGAVERLGGGSPH